MNNNNNNITSETMTELINLITYLKDRKVPFLMPIDIETGKMKAKYPELKITKKGKFYYANGVRVARNMINNYIQQNES